MMNDAPLLIKSNNLSHAWANLLLRILDGSGKEISTVLMSLTDFKDGEVVEDVSIRLALDACLCAINEQEVHTVANTIFPENLWKLSRFDRHKLFEKYEHNFPRIKALASCKNNRGTYFKRLISFDESATYSNQLEHIISQYISRSGVRRTMFQASVFDPKRDHTRSALVGFPCLQHLQFIPDNKGGKLIVNAYYATQQVLEKAYGNYLGICRLGHFMAHEMQLSLSNVNFFVGVAKLDKQPKTRDCILQLKDTVKSVTLM